jgi:hypothetical protein
MLKIIATELQEVAVMMHWKPADDLKALLIGAVQAFG